MPTCDDLFMLLLALCVLPVGLVLLAIGLRGRRVDDHPVCRRCRFDLIGLAEAPKCPECGAGLAAHSAVRIGHRKRRRALLAAGVLFSMVALTLAGADRWSRYRGYDWNTVKPGWWLAAEAQGPVGTPAADAALTELLTRLKRDTLSQGRARSMISAGLARQADPAATWSERWSEFIELGWDNGLLSQEQKAAYARAYPASTISGRPVVARNAPWMLYYHFGAARVSGRQRFQIQVRPISLAVDDEPEPTPAFGDAFGGLSSIPGGATGLPIKLTAAMGKHTVHARWHCAVKEAEGTSKNNPILASWDEDLTTPVEILPEGTATVSLLSDESLRSRIEAAITASRCTAKHSGSGRGERMDASGLLSYTSLPAQMACRISWRYADATAPGGFRECLFQAADMTQGAGMRYGGTLPLDFAATQVDIILRPDIDKAAQSEWLTQIWSGEIVIRNQPVTISSAGP